MANWALDHPISADSIYQCFKVIVSLWEGEVSIVPTNSLFSASVFPPSTGLKKNILKMAKRMNSLSSIRIHMVRPQVIPLNPSTYSAPMDFNICLNGFIYRRNGSGTRNLFQR